MSNEKVDFFAASKALFQLILDLDTLNSKQRYQTLRQLERTLHEWADLRHLTDELSAPEEGGDSDRISSQ